MGLESTTQRLQEEWLEVKKLHICSDFFLFIIFIFLNEGVAAIGANFIAVGIHTGTILLFEVTSAQPSFICQLVDSQRCHIVATTDLASTSTSANEVKIPLEISPIRTF